MKQFNSLTNMAFLTLLHRNHDLMNAVHSTISGSEQLTKVLAALVKNPPIPTVFACNEYNEGLITLEGYGLFLSLGHADRIKNLKNEQATKLDTIPGEIVDKWPEHFSRVLCAVEFNTYRALKLSPCGKEYRTINGWFVAQTVDGVLLMREAANDKSKTIEIHIGPMSDFDAYIPNV